jgi:hypothetical protein
MKHKKRYIILGTIVFLLIVFRLLLSVIVLKYANKELAQIHGYYEYHKKGFEY